MLFDQENAHDDMKITFRVVSGREEAPLVEVYSDEDGYIGDYPAWDGFALYVTTSYGDQYMHDHTFDNREDAKRFQDKVEKALKDRELDPKHWSFLRYEYGTQGWLKEVEPELVKADKDPNYIMSAVAKY